MLHSFCTGTGGGHLRHGADDGAVLDCAGRDPDDHGRVRPHGHGSVHTASRDRKDSITVEEEALHGAVVRALNRFHTEDESTYLTLMKATIGEAIGINGGSEEIDLLTRRIDALNKRMLDLVNETVAAGKDVESSEDEFKGISDQIEQFNRRIAAIQESIHKDGSRQARLEEIQSIIAERNANETQYDDSIVRQMIECIKVHSDGKLTIIFGGGYEIEETL